MSKFTRSKYLLAGIVIGGTVFSGVTYASQQIKLIVNGQVIQSDVPPQVINGRTMVPARALVEALGAKAVWDAKNRAVVVEGGAADPIDLTRTTEATKVDLVKEFKPFKTVGSPNNDPVTVLGVKYNNVWRMGGDTLYWNLDNKYGKLIFSTACRDENNDTGEVEVYGDGKLIGSTPKLTVLDDVKTYEFNVSGVKLLSVKSASGEYGTMINPVLIKK